MTEQQWVDQLRQEGYQNVEVHKIAPNLVPGEHTHELPTVHVIMEGELIITDSAGQTTYKEGERVDFLADTKHHAAIGEQGLRMVVANRIHSA